ncbi:acyl--CoA ligase [Candidatus Sumerlaeota bacterium]|nr:acyl--CoA ligase [Candidatus Sumerlaeota bacterium]
MNIISKFHYFLEKDSDRKFYIDVINDKIYTRGEFYRESLKLAGFLREIGIKKGDKIATILPNSLESALFFFAALYTQTTIIPLNPILHPSEVEYILKSSKPKIVFFTPSTYGQLTDNVKNDPAFQIVELDIYQERNLACPFSGKKIGSEQIFQQLEPEDIDRNIISEDHLFSITYTSGTTQTPKGVMHKLSNFVNNAEKFTRQVGVGMDNGFYGVLSQAYMGGFYNLLLLPWICGASVGFGKSFDALTAISFWDAPMKYNLNSIWLVPTIMAILLKVDRNEQGREYARNNIRLALVGTAPLPIPLRKEFEKHYGVRLYENYGLSEILFVSANSPPQPVRDGSVGKPLQEISISIRNQAGGVLSTGQEGEIFVQTGDCMLGYFGEKQPENIQGTTEQSWFDTGDVGRFDEDGNLFITGRKKDLIIRGGVNISPSAIENIIMEHPVIQQAAIVGVPHEIYGEDIAAVVKLKTGFTLKQVQNELEELCKQKLGQVRKPSMFFEIEEFPLSTSGKIQKIKLKELLVNKLGK